MDAEQRANEAQYLLNHALIRDAFTEIEQAIIGQLRTCPLKDREGQHELTLMLQTLARFKAHLESHIATGQMAKQPSVMDSVAARVQSIKDRMKSRAI